MIAALKHKSSTVLDMTGLEGDELGNVQEIKIRPYYERIYASARIYRI